AELEKAEKVNPQLPYLHFGLGIAYMRTGDDDRAEAEFRKEIAIEPDFPDIYEQLGEFYLKQDKITDAEKNFREALKRNPRMPASLYGLAKIHVREEKYREALPEIDAAVRLAPENQNVHFMRGRILLKLGRRAEGEKEMARAKELLDAAADREKTPSAM